MNFSGSLAGQQVRNSLKKKLFSFFFLKKYQKDCQWTNIVLKNLFLFFIKDRKPYSQTITGENPREPNNGPN